MIDTQRKLPTIRIVRQLISRHADTQIDIPRHFYIDALRIILPNCCKSAIVKFESFEHDGMFSTDYVPAEIFNSFTSFIMMPELSHIDRLIMTVKDQTPMPEIYDDTPAVIELYILGK